MGREARIKRERNRLKREGVAAVPWTPFERSKTLITPEGMVVECPADVIIFTNSRYQVWLRKVKPERHSGWPDFAHLSIKRNDKRPIHDWRDLQRIKNELIGAEHEGVEIYPAESRLVDGANQYHLWVAMERTWRWPTGFNTRLVSEGAGVGEQQRPFEPDQRPADTGSHDGFVKDQAEGLRRLARSSDFQNDEWSDPKYNANVGGSE